MSEKVFAFLGGFEKTLRRMDDAEVNGYIKSLVETKEQKIVRLSDETLLHWGEIVTGKYKYDRTLVEAKTTKELNKAFLVKVWQDVIASGGSRRRVLTSEVYTQADGKAAGKMSSPVAAGSTLLGDIAAFQRSTEIISDEAGNAPPIEPIEFGGMI